MSAESRKIATLVWRKNNPERYASFKSKDQRKRNEERWTLIDQLKRLKHINNGASRGALAVEELLEMWENQKGLCAVTGVQMTFVHGSGKVDTNVSIDRVEAGGPYILENIRLVCYRVNVMRNNMTSDDLLWWCNKIVDGSRI